MAESGRRYLKRGMGGSRCGRGRSEKTAVLKEDSKKARRQEGRQEAAAGLEDALVEKQDCASDSDRVEDQ